MKNIDYKKLLEKYIEHVDQCEGSNFIFWINKDSDVSFSEEEIKALKKLSH